MENKGVGMVIIGLLMLGLGLQHAQQIGACKTTAQDDCMFQCVLNEEHPDDCIKICGCILTDVLAAGHDRCRLGCSSKCNHANKQEVFNLSSVGEYVKEQCNHVCYSLCAKGIDITAA